MFGEMVKELGWARFYLCLPSYVPQVLSCLTCPASCLVSFQTPYVEKSIIYHTTQS